MLEATNNVVIEPALERASVTSAKELTTAPFIFAVVITSIYLLVAYVGLTHHEMWHDEFQAWLIARDSATIFDLFSNTRYEGCPPLWHLCLLPITRVASDPFAMQVFNLLINTTTVFLVARFAPFPWYARAMFPFGYFMLFEYGLISRSYSLGNLLIVGFCLLYSRPQKMYVPLFVVLSLLAATSVYGTIIAIALVAGLCCDAIRPGKSSIRMMRIPAFGVLIMIVSLLVAITLMHPPEDSYGKDWSNQAITRSLLSGSTAIRDLSRAAGSVLCAYLPIPAEQYHFWETSIFRRNFYTIPPQLALWAVSLFAVYALALLRVPMALVSYVLGTSGIVLFSYLFYTGAMRHFGQLFILLVACMWLFKYGKVWIEDHKALKEVKNLSDNLLVVFLALHLVYGIFSYSIDFGNNFAQSNALVAYLKRSGLANEPIVAAPPCTGTGISALLHRKVYHLDSERVETFILDRPAQRIGNWEVAIQRIEAFKSTTDRAILLVSDRPFRTRELKTMKLRACLLETFQGSIVPTQDLFLYRITSVDP